MTKKTADEKIQRLMSETKGRYITQACAFNKECPRQMELLKFALEHSVSFSSLVKELLAIKLSNGNIQSNNKVSSINIEETETDIDLNSWLQFNEE
jgi:hypothetical protein